MNNKINKNIFALLIFAFTLLVTLSGCNFFENDKDKTVSTLDELLEATGDSNIVLVNDIDGGFETINSICCKSFDGQGFTIKNLVINNPESTASLFTNISNGSIEYIKNAKFDNIAIYDSSGYGSAIICLGGCKKIENIHVINSSVKCKQTEKHNCATGGIYGGFAKIGKDRIPQFYGGCEITNSSVINTNIEIEGYEKTTTYYDIYCGGISGYGGIISNCFTENCKIITTTYNPYTQAYTGGIVGYTERSIEKSYYKENTLHSISKYYSKGAFSSYSTSTIEVGGIVGCTNEIGNVKYCFSENNSIIAESRGSIFAGGLVGCCKSTIITQSYVKGVDISMEAYAKGNANHVERRGAGLIGFSTKSSLSSCFSYGNKVIDICKTDLTFDTDSKIGGLTGEIESTMISNCATLNIKLDTRITDELNVTNSNGNIESCYISSNKLNNSNNCEIVDEVFWNTPSEIKSRLKLVGSYWQFDAGILPYLTFDNIE